MSTTASDNNNNKQPLVELSPSSELIFNENDSSEANSSVGSVRSGISHSTLEIKNVSESPVLFKIQSTAPIHYHVKPSHGRIELGEVKIIQFTMLSESMKSDKFSVNVGALLDDSDDNGDFNSQFSQISEKDIQKFRLKCPMPANSEEKNGLLAATGGSHAGSTENIISSPMAPSIRSRIPTNLAAADLKSPKSSLETSSVSSPSSASTNSTSISTLQRELNEARAEINRLKTSKSSVAREWKDVLTAQYGAPPVLVLLVAIFAFMLGLLFTNFGGSISKN